MALLKPQTSGSAGGSNRPLATPVAQEESQPLLQPYIDCTDLESEDSPPAYAEHSEPLPLVSAFGDSSVNGSLGSAAYDIPGGHVLTSHREGKTYTVSLAPYLSSNADVLYKFFKIQAGLPPQVFISVKGSHTVSRRNGDKQTSSETVTDFDFLIDGSDTVLPPATGLDGVYRVLKVMQDDDGVSAYRGGRFKSTRRFWRRRKDNMLEEGNQMISGPSFEEWCQRFCDDKSSVKSFTLHRDLVNWDFELIKREITSVIRSTHYRGTMSVSPFIRQSRVTIYSPSLINRLRTNSFVWWTCVILQLWIITWPLLVLLERRYEVVRVEHHVSRGGIYISPGGSESNWIKMFTPALRAAALTRRKGEVVTTADISRAQEMAAERQDSEAERERRERMNRGETTWSDSIVGLVRGISEATRQWSSDRGWGGDE
ncbi:hypothetical protein PRK78_003507 [Emydomyces testavorans]|uniref:Uncharacterized protein n=1 Tax=Emydomyces testavorans TaxID=2070801 RepID=A0AAF0DJ50_9EURO|nr:hypothetical protein PRK78_003507 [Emydomyces testavorans]